MCRDARVYCRLSPSNNVTAIEVDNKIYGLFIGKERVVSEGRRICYFRESDDSIGTSRSRSPFKQEAIGKK